jgi:hypothetical protein
MSEGAVSTPEEIRMELQTRAMYMRTYQKTEADRCQWETAAYYRGRAEAYEESFRMLARLVP